MQNLYKLYRSNGNSADMLEKIANALELKPQELFAEPIGNLNSINKKDRILAKIVEVLNEEM